MNLLNIPEELRNKCQWVCAREGSKVPFMSEICNMPASSSDPETWSEFAYASRAIALGWYDYVGFVFNNSGYVGIDIDDGYKDGELSETALDIITACSSYTEKSRSGRGFHIVVRGDMPIDGMNNRAGVEIYKAKRYFIMTGDTVLFDKIYDRQSSIDYVLQEYFPSVKPVGTFKNGNRIYDPKWMPTGNGRLPTRPKYPKIGEGSRNVSLLSLGGTLIRSGHSDKQILDELRKVNATACVPPLKESELMSVYKSVMRYK